MSTQPMAGYPHDDQLRARIQAFSPDEPGVVFPFSARLARENGWSRALAQRVMEEYRRFVYLAMTAGHPVTPSEQVDEAWHFHLTYTRSYWEEMCGRVLGRPLHHEPTKGGRAEGDKFVDWYARTLDSYRRAFGEAPPADIWPSAAERFAPAGRTRQVSDATHWVIRKPRLPRRRLAAAGVFGALLTVAACTAGEAVVSVFSITAVLLIAGSLVGAAASSSADPAARRKREGSDGGGGADGSGSSSSSSSGADCDADGGGDCGDGGGGDGGGGDGGGGCGGGCGGCGGG